MGYVSLPEGNMIILPTQTIHGLWANHSKLPLKPRAKTTEENVTKSPKDHVAYPIPSMYGLVYLHYLLTFG